MAKKSTKSGTKKSTKKTNNSLEKTAKKTVKKTAKKAAKKHPGLVIALVVVAVLVVGALAVLCVTGVINIPAILGTTSNTTQTVNTVEFEGVVYDDFQIHFLELGNWYTGDSVYIKAGDNDILIDAGSKYDSADDIEGYINNYVTDGKLEYVIATHAHEDHIAGFSGGSAKNGILYHYEIGTIIEFARTNSNSGVYNNYVTARNYAVEHGTTCYTALQMYNNTNLRTVSLGTDMSMTTLYQKYYEQDASTENDYSACTLFTYKEHHFLFTGDLESGGESSLVDSNTLPHCELYKAGHHGSKTSSSDKLMAAVQPKVVCVCCCCGSDEYTKTDANQFPTQEFVNRVAPYTSNVYVTSISVDNENKIRSSMNGYIIFSSNGANYSVACSNNQTVLKDTEWFKTHRTTPSAWS